MAGDDDTTRVLTAQAEGYSTFTPEAAPWDRIALLVLAPGIPLYAPVQHAIVRAAFAHGIPVIGDIELFARADAGAHKTVGITGTNGKSTTTALITHILNTNDMRAVCAGNIGVPVMGVDLHADTVVVLELSSFQIDICPNFRPDIAVHLNITPDHIDRHGSLEHYISVKERIFEGSGIGFCGIDDEASRGIYERARTRATRRMIAVSCDNALNEGISLSSIEIADTIFSGGVVGSLGGLPNLRGRHNHQNAMMAYGVCRALGLAPDQIFRAIGTYPGLAHRQLLVRSIRGVDYINDSKATNADAAEKALQTFDHIHWILGGRAKAGGLNGLEGLMGRVRHAYLIGEAAGEFSKWLSARNVPFTLCDTLERAVEAAHRAAQAENGPATVLLSPACASYDQFASYEHRGTVFTDLVQKIDGAVAA
jgi:UDP-N-acetylmuramoylalanine--D-glutamate ligase